MLELRIGLLGGFRVRVGPQEVADGDWHLRKSRDLVKLLALVPGHRLHRDRAVAALWPELPPPAGAELLHQALDQARRTLDARSSATHRFLAPGDTPALRPELVRVDVEEFERAALHARRSRDPAAYERAVARYRGDLLPEDRYEEWAAGREQALHAEYLALLVELGGLREARADLDGAAAVLRRAVAADPLHEEASLALMRVHALAGRRYEVLREYDRLAAALEREPDGGGPGPAAQRLWEQVRTGREVRAERAGELWERVGDLRMRSGDTAGAVAAYGCALVPAVVDLPASPGLPTPAAVAAAARGGVVLRAARLHRKAAAARLAGGDGGAAEPHLSAAESVLAGSGGDPAETGRLLGVRAAWLASTGRDAPARRAAEAGLAAAEEHGTPEDLAAADEALARVHHAQGTWREGLHRDIERLGPAGDARTDRIFELHGCLGQYQHAGDGPGDGVEDYARRTLDLAIARGARRAEAFAWCLLGESLLLHGRWNEAPGCLEHSARLHEELGGPGGALPWQRLAEHAAGSGDSAAAADFLRRGAAAAATAPPGPHTFGGLYATAAFDAVERGEPGEAVRAARAAAAAAARYGECPSCTALLYPVAAEACAAVGDAGGAAEHAAAARALAGRFESPAWRAMAQSALGSLAAVKGDRVGARAGHLAAARLYERARQPYWAAREKVWAVTGGPRGEGVPGAGPASDAVLCEEAAEVFEALGARRALERLRAAPVGAGGRPGGLEEGVGTSHRSRGPGASGGRGREERRP
ncbi:BTAD domain-containing putative transcriptional regulator [Kitasatospora sp. NPDC048239]|uniref:BTAD domain-containing putative transcriptional regulator n=1 Tax=Kitasatospora sp. NPDC048239 TaxID=3364046 RepID=UPI00371A957C